MNENEKERKYTLAYGFRRFAACKKLGWNTIPVFNKNEGKVFDIPIDEIFLPENTRLEENNESFIELMQSIKQHGLLQPVGVWDTKDLTEKEYLILNLIENVHREGVSPFGLSQAVKRLTQLGLTEGEIAVRLSLPKSRIEAIARLSKKLPKSIMQEISYIGENKRDTAGKLPISVVQTIASLRLPNEKENILKLVELARKEELTVDRITVIGSLINSGMSVEEAIKQRDKYKVIGPKVTINLEEFEKEYGKSTNYSEIINSILSKKIPAIPKIFYYERKIKTQSEDSE